MSESSGGGSLFDRMRRRLSGEAWAADCVAVSLTGARAENQDNFLVMADRRAEYLIDQVATGDDRPDWPAGRVRAMVFDGMGGHRDGRQVAEAAALAAADLPPQQGEAMLRDTLNGLHRGLLARFHRADEPGSPGATLVWLEVDLARRQAWIAQVGDSRIYQLRGGQWRCLTHDHTLVEFNWRDDEIDDLRYQELKGVPGQRLVQAIGYGSWGIRQDDRGIKPFVRDPGLRLDLVEELPAGRSDHADVRALSLHSGDRLLLASDGLWDLAADGQWQGPGTLSVAQSTVRGLAEMAINRGSRDNVTAVLVGLGPA